MIVAPLTISLRDHEPVMLRSPTVADAEAVLAFRRSLLGESADNMNQYADSLDQVTPDDQRAMIMRMADAPRGFILAAFSGDAVVGSLSVYPEGGERLAHVGVIGMGCLAAYQGRGLGSALLREAIRNAEASGTWNLRLTVRTFNEAGIALYERSGFERVGTYKASAKVGEGFADEYVYQRVRMPD